MSDVLNFYIKESSCNMENCPYGVDIECSDCNKKMVEEHDKQIRADAIEEFLNELKNYTLWEEHETILEIVAEQLKEQKNGNA